AIRPCCIAPPRPRQPAAPAFPAAGCRADTGWPGPCVPRPWAVPPVTRTIVLREFSPLAAEKVKPVRCRAAAAAPRRDGCRKQKARCRRAFRVLAGGPGFEPG